MISLAYHEKGHKIQLMSIALSSMTRKRYKGLFWHYLIIFYLTGLGTDLLSVFFLKKKNEGRASRRWNILVV